MQSSFNPENIFCFDTYIMDLQAPSMFGFRKQARFDPASAMSAAAYFISDAGNLVVHLID